MVLDKLSPWHILLVPIHIFTLYIFDLYNIDSLVNSVRSSVLVVVSIISAGVVMSGILFFIPKYVFGRQVLLIYLFSLSLLLVIWRLIFLNGLSVIGRKKKIALLCHTDTAKVFMDFLSQSDYNQIEVSHVFCKNGNMNCENSEIKFCSSFSELLGTRQFDILAYDSSKGNFTDEEIRLILEIRQRNINIYEISSLYTNLSGKVPLEIVDGKWVMNSEGLQGLVSKPYIRLKRLFDVVVSCTLLIVLYPLLWILIAATIRMESKGNIIFFQERLGLNRKPFSCYKFRTMVENAEELSGPVWAGDNDPRITKVGKFLRKTRLDELPQLWNILKGDISFVGPRPIRKHFADKLSKQIPFYELRFSVQPGLSGWAQVNHNYAGSEDGQREKFQYELFYIQNMSLFLDVIIIFKTIRSFLKVEGK